MSKKVLVIGYGSIGKRHVEILSKISSVSNVYTLTNQNNVVCDKITSFEEIPSLNPEYIIIASPTSQHFMNLKFLEKNLEGKLILVEKPLFEKKYDFNIINNQVYVGYNLRFHPLILEIKKIIKNRKLWNIQVFCGSFLPEWRPNIDYRLSSSAKKSLGGGVLLDLSHELDYIQWLVGPLILKSAVSSKISNLEIDTDDLLLLSAQDNNGTHIHISLNYFTRKPTRKIIIDGEGISIQCDLISNQLNVYLDDKPSQKSWKNLKRNDTYNLQHQAIINGDSSYLCDYNDGLRTMNLINNIMKISK